MHNDSYVAVFMPQLQKYNGIELLKKQLRKSRIPSWNSIDYALVLYQQTEEEVYLDVLKKNLEEKQLRLIVLSSLLECKPSEDICQIFEYYCIHDDDPVNRGTAATGILYCKGIMNDPDDYTEFKNNMELLRKLTPEDKEMRKKAVEEFLAR